MPSIFRRRSSSSRSLAAHAHSGTSSPAPAVSSSHAPANGTSSTAASSVVLVSPPPPPPPQVQANGNGHPGALLGGPMVQDPEAIDAGPGSGPAALGKGAPPGRELDDDGRKRKGSLSRTRKRISSLFRSPSTSSHLAARSTSASPSPSPSPSLLAGASPAPSPRASVGSNGLPLPAPSTSAQGTPRGSLSAGVGGASKPPPAPSAGAGVGTPGRRAGGAAGAGPGPELGLGRPVGGSSGAVGATALVSPDSGIGAVSGLPATTSSTTGSSKTPVESSAAGDRDRDRTRDPSASHRRTSSLYSEWSTDAYEVDSDSDGEVYATPPEGLSEVEEEDDEEDARSLSGPAGAGAGAGVGAAAANGRGRAAGKADGSASRPNGAAKAADALDHGEPAIHRAAVDGPTSVPVAPIMPTLPAAGHAHLTAADQAAGLSSDIASCQRVIELFLTSRMKEAERFCYAQDPTGEKMYLQNAAAVIQCIKGMMTFDQNDLATALEIAKRTSALANSLRKPQSGLLGRVAGVVRSGSGIAQIQSMSLLEKHAELVYAESLLIKAVLGIVAGGDWLGLIKEALNMRTAHGIYRTLQAYLDAEAKSGKVNTEIDEHFKSGVELGTGLSSLMLSLMPGKALRVAELFGYAGNRDVALATLMAPGGWSEDSEQSLPSKGKDVEGVRRPVCDMALLTFHLVIPILMPIGGVNVPLAKNILKWNLERYPNGIFFMYFKSRLHTTQSQPEMANDTLQEALDLKLEYLQLQHMCLWDMGVNNMMLCTFSRARSCFEVLTKESNWSKAVYLYSSAACAAEMKQQGSDKIRVEDIVTAMHEVPRNTRKIAGKSLPIEKYVTRKARKYLGQDNRLMLPGVELGYFFGALANTPPRILYQTVIPLIRRNLERVEASSPEQYGKTEGEYWEDYCLAQFLLGVSASFAGHPHAEAVITVEDRKIYTMTSDEAAATSKAAFEAVLANARHIQLDHWLVYFTHFEYGRLESQLGDNAAARHHLQLVASGKAHEATPGVKGKYSMESALALKVHAAMQVLKDSDTAKML